jgi:hypothetical protein
MTALPIADTDPHALVGRVLDDLELEPEALTLSRADVENVAALAFQFGAAKGYAEANFRRACRICGCTEFRACHGGCAWVEVDLCSACEPFVQRAFIEGTAA